jgi:hypothetical protein
MFERGIDPDVMDPTKIHSHSECPKQNSDWPAYEEVKDYVQQCHEKILEAFDQTKNSTENKWTAKRKSSHNYNNSSDPIFNNIIITPQNGTEFPVMYNSPRLPFGHGARDDAPRDVALYVPTTR